MDLNEPPNESETAAYIVTDVPTVVALERIPGRRGGTHLLGNEDGPHDHQRLVSFSTPSWGLNDIEDVDALEDFDSLDSGYVTEGTYELEELDFGSIQTARCSMLVEFSGFDRSQSFDDIADLTPSKNFDGDTAGATIKTQISTSRDGVSYSDWMDFVVGDFTARYISAGLYDSSGTPRSGSILISAIHSYADMPDRSESGQDVTCGSGGITPSFTNAVHGQTPVGVTIQGWQMGTIRTSIRVS